MKVGLGTVQFGMRYGISNSAEQVAGVEVTSILKYAKENGIKVVDTAAIYGTSETELGKNDLAGFKLVSKFMPLAEYGSLRKQLSASLVKLKISALYGYLAHRPMELVKQKELWMQLWELKREGLIEKIGYSVNTLDEISYLIDMGYVPDIIQAPFNYFDQRFAAILKALKEQSCEIHTRSAFLQGLFFSDVEKLPSFFDPVKQRLTSLQQSVPNLPAALLNYVTKQSFIDVVVVGVQSLAQMKASVENLGSFDMLPELNVDAIPESLLMPSLWPTK